MRAPLGGAAHRRASPVRAAPRATRARFPASARRPARRSIAAGIASNRSITSSRTKLRLSKFHPLTVAHVARETRDAVALRFAVPPSLAEAFRFVQGQHLTLRADIGGEDMRRSYSICSAVQDGDLRIAV